MRLSTCQFSDEAKYGQVHGNNNATNNPAEKYYHQRLDQGEKIGDGGIRLFLVKVGHFLKHLIQFTRLFSYTHHLDHHGRELSALLQGFNKRISFLNSLSGVQQSILNHQVSRRTSRNVEGFKDGNTAGEKGS